MRVTSTLKTVILCFLLQPVGLLYGQQQDTPDRQKIDSLIRLNRQLVNAEKYEEALKVIDLADALILEKFGAQSTLYANSRFNRGRTFDFMVQYDEAEKYYVESIKIWDESIEKKEPPYCWALSNLAGVYASRRAYARADSTYAMAIAVSREVVGTSSINLGLFLYNYAHFYNLLGYYEKSLPLLLESQAVFERAVGKKDADYYGWILMELAVLYKSVGQYKKAELILLEARDIWQAAYGKESSNYAAVLNNLANTYEKLAEYERIEPLLQESIDIQKKRVPFQEGYYALYRDNLAVYYSHIGKLEACERIYLETTSIYEKLKGKQSDQYANHLNNLGAVYFSLGQFEKSEQFFREALQIRQNIFKADHPNYAKSLNDLGDLYLKNNRLDSAAVFFERALAMRQRLLGKVHPDYGESLRGLAETNANLGRLDIAETLLKEVVELQGLFVGKNHPKYAEALGKLASVYIDWKKFDQAEPLLLEVEKLNRQFVSKAMYFLTENELEQYRAQSRLQSDAIFSVLQQGYRSTGMLQAAWEQTVTYKGLLLDKNRSMARVLSAAPDSIQLLSDIWKGYQRQLYDLYLKPKKNGDSLVLRSLEDRTAKAEQQLVRLSAVQIDNRDQVYWKDLHFKLNSREAALEFISFRDDDDQQEIVHYAALLLLPNDTVPHYVYLFEEKQLGALLEKSTGEANATSALYAARSGELLDAAPTYGTELYNLVWRPLDSLLNGIKTVYFSPAGLLHRVAFGILPVKGKKVLADRYALHLLGSIRNLAVKAPRPVPQNISAAVFGGVQYDRPNPTATDSTATEIPDNWLWAQLDRHRTGNATSFDYLPGTEKEANVLDKALRAQGVRVQTYTGAQATEETLKSMGRDSIDSPDILHIATHGFFFTELEQHRRQQDRMGSDNAFKWNENPLFRSGLAFAGANATWSGQLAPGNIEDGIATAYEISHLNLSNTKLVVLSACETGLGDIKGSEGVYGLQRAFKMAGADYLLVSLWQVPDKETAEFMEAFYQLWLSGKTIHEAYTKAQKKLRKKYRGAYQWGAWVLVE